MQRSEVRAATTPGAVALRAAPDGDDQGQTLFGRFAVFNTWTLIDSAIEGTFRERIDPHAFDLTLAEDRDKFRVLFQHGRDPQTGDKPLGAIDVLHADPIGVAYEVRLLDTLYVAELVPGLKSGLYGASFRFRVDRDDWNYDTDDGTPERVIRELKLYEFGPVTFPAYTGATAGVRSLTDWYRRSLN